MDAQQNNIDEEIIELTDLIAKGDKAAPDTPRPEDGAAVKPREGATGTNLESLNDVAATSPEGDIDDLLAQMDAHEKDGLADPVEPLENPAEILETDATGHIVDPHEKLDMSGMEEVDNLLSSLQIPLKPPSAAEEEDMTPIQKIVESNETPAPNILPNSQSAAAQKTTPTAAKELATELDEILAAACMSSLPPDGDIPQVEQAPAISTDIAENDLPASQTENTTQATQGQPPLQTPPPTQPLQDTAIFQDEPAVDIFQNDVLPLPDNAHLQTPIESATDFSPEQLPEEVEEQKAVDNAALLEEELLPPIPDKLDAQPSLLAEGLQKNKEQQSGQMQNLESLEQRLALVELAISSGDKNTAQFNGHITENLESLKQRLTILESTTATDKEDAVPVEENAQSMHAYMDLAARLDNLEARLKAMQEIEERLNMLETHQHTALAQFETHVDKMAANAVAKLLREEIAKLLAD